MEKYVIHPFYWAQQPPFQSDRYIDPSYDLQDRPVSVLDNHYRDQIIAKTSASPHTVLAFCAGALWPSVSSESAAMQRERNRAMSPFLGSESIAQLP